MANSDPLSKHELERQLNNKINSLELNKVICAFEMAEDANKNKRLADGSSLFGHIARVSRIIIEELNIHDSDLIIASLLHNIYDCSEGISREIIEYNFGTYVSMLIDTMRTNKPKPSGQNISIEPEKAGMINVPGDDFLIIRLAENLDKFRSMDFDPKYNPIDCIKEAAEQYFPYAELSNNEKLQYLLKELKKERNKITG